MKNLFLFLFLSVNSFGQGTISQKRENWCWAACIQYFIQNHNQCAIVNMNNIISEQPLDDYGSCECITTENINSEPLPFASQIEGESSYFILNNTRNIFLRYNFHAVENFIGSWNELYEEIYFNHHPFILYSTISDNVLNGDHYIICDELIENPDGSRIMKIKDPWGVCSGSDYTANYSELNEINIEDTLDLVRDDNAKLHYWVSQIYPISNKDSFIIRNPPTRSPNLSSPICLGSFNKLLPYATKANALAINHFKNLEKCFLQVCKGSECYYEKPPNVTAITLNPNLFVKTQNLSLKSLKYNANPELIYQLDNSSNFQLTIVKKPKVVINKYGNEAFRKKNPVNKDFYIVRKIDYTFSYLNRFAEEGNAFNNIPVSIEGREIRLGKENRRSFSLVKYDFLQTHFFVFRKGFTQFAFFEKGTNFKKIKNYKEFEGVKLSTLLQSLKVETLEEAKQFANIPKGTLYSR